MTVKIIKVIFFTGLIFIVSMILIKPNKNNQECNVLFLLQDTLRADHLSCYGYPEPVSPYIDLLAKQGIYFSDFTAQSSWTIPSVTSLLTSTYTFYHGVTKKIQDVPELLRMFPEILRKQGYETCAVVGNGNLAANKGFSRGYNNYVEAWKISNKKEIDGLHTASFLNELALDWLWKNRYKKFFLYIHYLDTHSPYLLPENQPNLFYPNYTGSIPTYMSETIQATNSTYWDNSHKFFWNKVKNTRKEQKYIRSLYDTKIRYFDNELGRLLLHMKRWRILDKTMVVFLSDHGEGLFQRRFWEHGGKPYMEQVWVPALFFMKKWKINNNLVSIPVNTIDIAPTLLDLLGLPKENIFQGESLVKYFYSEKAFQPRAILSEVVVAETKKKYKSLKLGDWKLIVNQTDRKAEFYNLADDPMENINVFNIERLKANAMVGAINKLIIQYKINNPYKLNDKKGISIPDKETLEALRSLGYVD